MSITDYRNFDLLITRAGAQYQASGAVSMIGNRAYCGLIRADIEQAGLPTLPRPKRLSATSARLTDAWLEPHIDLRAESKG